MLLVSQLLPSSQMTIKDTQGSPSNSTGNKKQEEKTMPVGWPTWDGVRAPGPAPPGLAPLRALLHPSSSSHGWCCPCSLQTYSGVSLLKTQKLPVTLGSLRLLPLTLPSQPGTWQIDTDLPRPPNSSLHLSPLTLLSPQTVQETLQPPCHGPLCGLLQCCLEALCYLGVDNTCSSQLPSAYRPMIPDPFSRPGLCLEPSAHVADRWPDTSTQFPHEHLVQGHYHTQT